MLHTLSLNQKFLIGALIFVLLMLARPVCAQSTPPVPDIKPESMNSTLIKGGESLDDIKRRLKEEKESQNLIKKELQIAEDRLNTVRAELVNITKDITATETLLSNFLLH